MTDYSKMSDFEINVAVSLELFDGSSGGDTSRIATWCACKENGEYGLFDPCNNPADAWPIIVENEICIEFENDEVEGVRQVWAEANIGHPACNGFQYFSDENPLRAAMIVFLMMKDAENAMR
ncbi:DUF2591 family protein [Serratia nevei]|uniref:phage protein NinX family protein n=1 Tax=Serratia TaxID=613 RepID=UPI00076065F6|nr:phage protein NinX family protein [Serratia marcescens]